jgi:hypothetical protein
VTLTIRYLHSGLPIEAVQYFVTIVDEQLRMKFVPREIIVACTSFCFCGDEAILVHIVAARPWGVLRGDQEPVCGRRLVPGEYRFILFYLHKVTAYFM